MPSNLPFWVNVTLDYTWGCQVEGETIRDERENGHVPWRKDKQTGSQAGRQATELDVRCWCHRIFVREETC